MILDDTSLKLEAVLTGAVAANQPEVHVDYVVWNNENTSSRPATYRSALNNTTDVVILPAPTTKGYVLEPQRVIIYNKDTASITVIVKTDNATTERIEVRQTVTTLKSLCWEKGVGWYQI